MKSDQIENFSRTDQRLLQVFEDYIAIALHNVRQFEDALEKSSYDYLTGIYNRSALMQLGEDMLENAKKSGHSIGVLMMDIDDFKQINDTFGHMQGDAVITVSYTHLDVYKRQGCSLLSTMEIISPLCRARPASSKKRSRRSLVFS